MFIGKYNKSVILTYIGLALAVTGIFLSTNVKIKEATICLLLAGTCDLFDGKVARMCKRTKEEKEFGVQIDSLVDLIAFGVLPTTILYNSVQSNLLCIIIYIAYVLCALIRLAYFNVVTAETDKAVKEYSGLPVTTVAFIYPIIWLVIDKLNLPDISKILLMGLTALLFITNFKIKKPQGKAYILFSIVGIISLALLILI